MRLPTTWDELLTIIKQYYRAPREFQRRGYVLTIDGETYCFVKEGQKIKAFKEI